MKIGASNVSTSGFGVFEGGTMRYQPTRASAAAWQGFMDCDSIWSAASGRSWFQQHHCLFEAG
jgi:hypothetical protein